VARSVGAGFGELGFGRQGQLRTGTQRRVKARAGMAGKVRRGHVRRGMAGKASRVQDRNGVSRSGSLWQAWHGGERVARRG
jgi:hypothetical protein